MPRRLLTLLPLLALVALMLQSCAYRPSIDDQGIVTARAPNKFLRHQGVLEFENIKKTRQISHDPRYTKPVQRVAQRLKKVIEMPSAEWEFIIIKDNSPNAFALPGGKVGVNTGLFRIIGDNKDSEALLAAVLGHEISHAAVNHAEQRMYRGIALTVASAILWASLDHNGANHPDRDVAAFAVASYIADSLPFSRKQEYESDRIGAVYMAKAGYDPRKSIDLWRRLSSYHHLHGSKKPEFLRTHPHDHARIRALEEFMPIAMKFYHKNAK